MLPFLPGLPRVPGWIHQPGLPFTPRYVAPGDLADLPTDPAEWATWDLHASVVLGCLILGLGYLWLTGPLRRRLSLGPPPTRWQKAAFAASLATLMVALNGPIHHLSDYYLFTAHMVQHLLITQVFPPLLLLGLPGWLVTFLLRPRWLRAPAYVLTRPLVAYVLYNGMMVLWHIPSMYDWAMRDHDMHVVEHLGFMATAVIAWWPVTGASEVLPRPSYPMQVLYLFLLTVAMKITGAVIALQNDLIYTFYAAAPRVFPISPTGDQRFGGLIMWVIGDSALWLAMGVVFWRWARRDKTARPGALETGPLPLAT